MFAHTVCGAVQSGRKQKDIGSINHSHRLPGPIEKTQADRKLVLADFKVKENRSGSLYVYIHNREYIHIAFNHRLTNKQFRQHLLVPQSVGHQPSEPAHNSIQLYTMGHKEKLFCCLFIYFFLMDIHRYRTIRPKIQFLHCMR